MFDTKNTIYLTQKLKQDPFVVDATDREGKVYKITVKYAAIVDMTSSTSLQILNLILRRAMDGLKLQLVGRNLFDANAAVCTIILIMFYEFCLN